MARKLRIGMIGLGEIAFTSTGWLIPETENCEMIVGADAVEHVARSYQERFEIPCSTNLDDVLNHPDVDAVVNPLDLGPPVTAPVEIRVFSDDRADLSTAVSMVASELRRSPHTVHDHVKSLHVKLLKLWKLLGFEFLVNRSRPFRKFWEFYLCYIIRGKAMVFELEAVKS